MWQEIEERGEGKRGDRKEGEAVDVMEGGLQTTNNLQTLYSFIGSNKKQLFIIIILYRDSKL